MNDSKIKMCRVCCRYQTLRGDWVIISDPQKLNYVRLNVSVEHIICPQCLEEEQKRRIRDVIA